MRKSLSFMLLGVLSSTAFGETSNLEDLSLEDLMDVKVKVATETEKSLREAPGIITVITEEQIRALGARDLKEILISVPGITFGHDVLGNISIIMRGIWAQEGRILLNIDGIEMNERSYGTITLANHYSADHIKRIEIIRGPGSAIYGGFAELGVINVITKTGEDLKGLEVTSSNSRTSNDMGQSTNNFMIGHKKDDLSFSVKGTYTQANFSDRNYTDENGTTANLGKGNSHSDSEFLHMQSSFKNFYAQYIKDNYNTKNIVLWGDLENTAGSGVIRPPVPKQYLTDVYQVGYQADLTEKFNLHAYFSKKVQHPYLQPDASNQDEYANSWRRKVERKLTGVKTQFHFNKQLNLNLGTEQSEDTSWSLNKLTRSGSPDVFGHNGRRVAQITNSAVFSQLDFSSDVVNLTAGVRYDDPSIYDSTFVPRFGLTKVMGKTHVKALYAKAFRAPVIENISLNSDIKPEITTSIEAEIGYAFTPKFNWNTNLFLTRVDDIIVYSYDAGTDTEHYNNYDHVATKGIETEFLYKHDIQDIKLSYSFYNVDSLEAEPFKTASTDKSLIGAPRGKLFISDSVKLSENFKLTPSLTFLQGVYAYEWSGSSFSDKKLDNQMLANIFGNYKNAFFQGFEVGAGINNILNSNIYYSQPYVKPGDYLAGPYPGQSREYIIKVGYSKEY